MVEHTLSALKQQLEVCTRQDLAVAGHDRRDLVGMLGRGELVRLGRRWLGTHETPAEVAASLRRSHRLTCVSALDVHGVFVPPAQLRHEVGRQCTCPSPRGFVEHPPLRAWPDDEPIVPVRMALAHALGCLDAGDAAIVLESALHLGKVTDDDIGELLAGVSLRRQRAIGRVDGRAMSGSETKVRRLFERRGVRVRPQHHIDDVGFVDLLVGDRLIIECDSVEHHTDPDAYANDRRRDQLCVQLGYLVVRLTYPDVMLRWEETALLLRDLVSRGVHLNPRRRRSA